MALKVISELKSFSGLKHFQETGHRSLKRVIIELHHRPLYYRYITS